MSTPPPAPSFPWAPNGQGPVQQAPWLPAAEPAQLAPPAVLGLLETVAAEQAHPASESCGCDPDIVDNVGACTRIKGHEGPCVGCESGTGDLIQYVCRTDDANVHP